MADPPRAPDFIDEEDATFQEPCRFFRTELESAEQLVNAKAWIKVFEAVLKAAPKPRRTLGVSLSESADPRHTMPAFNPKQRNDALKAMRDPEYRLNGNTMLPEKARAGIGAKVRLPTGEEVLLLCNVGPHAPPTLPAKFQQMPLEGLVFHAVAARCPHQGNCLQEGEVKDVEDLTGGRRVVVRCPQHNMQFDAHTGQGEGNYLTLNRYAVRVMYGAVYVGVPHSRLPAAQSKPDMVAPRAEAGDQEMETLDTMDAPEAEDVAFAYNSMDDVAPSMMDPANAPVWADYRSRSPRRLLHRHSTC